MSLNLTSLQSPIRLRPAAALTDQELMRFSGENKPYKIERTNRGEITIMTPVGGTGSTHEAFVAYALLHWANTAGTGLAFISSAGFSLPDGSCLSPDAAWVSLDRWNLLSAEEQDGFPPLCPDFVIEVRSKNDSRRMLETKMQLWIDNGSALAWLVDPIDCSLAIYQPGEATVLLDRPAVVQGTGPVAGFVLDCNRLWARR